MLGEWFSHSPFRYPHPLFLFFSVGSVCSFFAKRQKRECGYKKGERENYFPSWFFFGNLIFIEKTRQTYNLEGHSPSNKKIGTATYRNQTSKQQNKVCKNTTGGMHQAKQVKRFSSVVFTFLQEIKLALRSKVTLAMRSIELSDCHWKTLLFLSHQMPYKTAAKDSLKMECLNEELLLLLVAHINSAWRSIADFIYVQKMGPDTGREKTEEAYVGMGS